MPIYEYECQACGLRSETMQRMSDPPLETCSACGGQLKKLISAPAFQFKGSGWYVTDYAGKQKGSDKDSDGSSDKSGGDKSGGDKASGDGGGKGDQKAGGDKKKSSDASSGSQKSDKKSAKSASAE